MSPRHRMGRRGRSGQRARPGRLAGGLRAAVDLFRRNPDPGAVANTPTQGLVAAGIGVLVLVLAVGTYLAVVRGFTPSAAQPAPSGGPGQPTRTDGTATPTASVVAEPSRGSNPSRPPATAAPGAPAQPTPSATPSRTRKPRPTPHSSTNSPPTPPPPGTPTPTPAGTPTPTPSP